MGLAEPSGEHQHNLALRDHKLLIWRMETRMYLCHQQVPQAEVCHPHLAVAQQLEAEDAKQNIWIISLFYPFFFGFCFL